MDNEIDLKEEDTTFASCPLCGADCNEVEYIGQLGKLHWFKCVCCGCIYDENGDIE